LSGLSPQEGFGDLAVVGYNSAMKRKETKFKPLGRFRTTGNLHAPGYAILLLANQGLLRPDFQREVSRRLLDFFGCDAVEMWLKDHEKYYPSETFRSLKEPSEIGFRTYRSYPVEELESNRDIPVVPPSLCTPFSSSHTIPLEVEGKRIAFLRLKSSRRDNFPAAKTKSYEGLARILGIALVHRQLQVDLRERIKELACLYGIARLSAQSDVPLEEVLQGIVELLPPAWLYPEITSARILLDRKSFLTPGFQERSQPLKADIIVSDEKRGTLEVVYGEEKPELDEGPFLKEERFLINAVAKEVAIILKRRQDDEKNAMIQEQLRHADRLVTIGQLASGVAHELNEPLGSVLGFAQLARKCPGIPLQADRDIEKILNASLYAREVVRKLLIFARQMPPRKVPVNLNQVVEEGLYLFEPRCSKEGIEVERSFSPGLPEVNADPSQLNQVLINLVINAIQAMPQGGKLSIRTGNHAGHVSLIVEDSGIGMDEEVVKKIFTPFFTTKDVGQGTGLGLAVVHGIITSHGGSIQVESKAGHGTRFEIQLPREGPAEPKGERP
jgi:signal transduction histidine kinase